MTAKRQCHLLVSIQNLREALAALAGGADILDVKDPTKGSLGRADSHVLRAIVRDERLREKAMLTAALGDLRDAGPEEESLPLGLGLVKLGLAGERNRADWRERFDRRASELSAVAPLIPVAYADDKEADAPDPTSILDFAIQRRSRGVLIDTCVKDGRGLFDHLPPAPLRQMVQECQSAGLFVALAGSLTIETIPDALALSPDVIAVRGAACRGSRMSLVDEDSVRRLSTLIRQWNSRISAQSPSVATLTAGR